MAMTVCQLLREDPELLSAIDPARRPRAVQECIVGVARAARGRWSPLEAPALQRGVGLLVLEGLLIRRVGIDGRSGSELLGEGDLLRPWQGEDAFPTLTMTTGWRVLEPARLALLDEGAARRLAAYPELTGRLVARALERARNLAINMTIVHQARVNVRLRMLLWHLADRWGRVRSDGVILPLRLTHTVLADLVAARRPTVTSALTELARQELVTPVKEGWLLTGEPPGELLALQEVGVSGPVDAVSASVAVVTPPAAS